MSTAQLTAPGIIKKAFLILPEMVNSFLIDNLIQRFGQH